MRPDVLAEHLATTIKGLLTPMSARVVALETLGARLESDRPVLATLTATLETLTARIGAVEARPPEPGPPGPPGPPGRDGNDGKAGVPGLRYCGVYVSGKTYDTGDLVTAGGSAWYCNRTTTTGPGDGRPDWTLMVKHGRDLRDPGRRSA